MLRLGSFVNNLKGSIRLVSKVKGWYKPYYRKYVGFVVMLTGFGMTLEHYIHYGGSLHLTLIDHGVIGVILFVAGALLASLRVKGGKDA